MYYWNKKKNFGDQLAPLLLKRFSRVPSEWSEPSDSDLVIIGSVLDLLPQDYSGIIAGAGKIHERTKVDFPNAKILAVRGPLTGQGLKNVVYGDPGLLADELIRRPDKEYNLGLIPHWTDDKLEFNPAFTKYSPKIIRVNDDPLIVIKEIAQCKKIVSSSLHGIILADAFGIPRRIELAPRMLTHAHQEGGTFKWRDYSASLDMKFEVGRTQSPSYFMVSQRQHELYDVFKELRGTFKHEKTQG